MNREIRENVMSEAYWKLWNSDVQTQIDKDIERHRKVDAVISDIPPHREVKIEQISHEFIFGAHIFNFDQLGSDELNKKYKELYGTLFNSATIPFYWYPFEPEEGKMRFKGEYKDSAEFWNNVADPKNEGHWRRPASDPVVEFCEQKGIRLHGHTLTWGSSTWQYPRWLLSKLPKEYLVQMLTDIRCGTNFMSKTADEIAEMIPEFADELNYHMERRIRTIAEYYGERLQSWDIVNESATDFEQERHIPDAKICKSVYGLMPGDYTYNSFRIAQEAFPESVKLNINDYNLRQCYPDQVNDLLKRDCKIDIMGAQMHMFDPQMCLDIADGKSNLHSPDAEWETMNRLSQANLPLHLSEITITAPNNDERGQAIQAVIARNLYRLWFSIEPMMGITWWNVVDDCGAPGEPCVSGIFSRNMEPKPAYFALDQLINHEWKTKLEAKADKDGKISFRGFRGKYNLTWQNDNGDKEQKTIILK